MLDSPSKRVFLFLTFISSKIDPRAEELEIYNASWEPSLLFHIPFWHCQILVLAGQQRLSVQPEASMAAASYIAQGWQSVASALITEEEQINQDGFYNCSGRERWATFWLGDRHHGGYGRAGWESCAELAWNSIKPKNAVLGLFPWPVYNMNLLCWILFSAIILPAFTSCFCSVETSSQMTWAKTNQQV